MSDTVEWLPTIPEELNSFKTRAVIGGEEDGSPLWVIRAKYNNDVIPGKINVNTHEASIPWGDEQKTMNEIEVACAETENIKWLLGSSGSVPSNAIVAGYVRATKEKLYVGRGKHLGQLIPGKIEPSLKSLSITYQGRVIRVVNYEVLCTTAPAETNPDGTDPDGTDPDGTDPDGTDPDGTDPDGTDPDGTGPDGTGPDGTGPDGTGPDGTEPDTKPDGAEPGALDPDGPDPDGTDPDGTGPDGTDPDGTEPDTKPNGTEPGATDPDGPNPNATDPDGTEPDTKPDGIEPEGTKPDGTDPDTKPSQ